MLSFIRYAVKLTFITLFGWSPGFLKLLFSSSKG